MSLLGDDSFFQIVASTVAPEGYNAWNLDLDVAPLNDNSSHTCAEMTLPFSNGLIIMNASIFTDLRVRLVTTNLAVTPIHCHSSPLLLLINTGIGAMGSGGCQPFCGPPTTCNLESHVQDLTIWNCHCPGATCTQIALAMTPGAFVDTATSAHICHVRFVYGWNSSMVS